MNTQDGTWWQKESRWSQESWDDGADSWWKHSSWDDTAKASSRRFARR